MLEHTLMNQTCKRVRGIPGACNLSHLTCTFSDLTSISLHRHFIETLQQNKLTLSQKVNNTQFDFGNKKPKRMSIVEIKLDLKRGLGFWWINFYKIWKLFDRSTKGKATKRGTVTSETERK